MQPLNLIPQELLFQCITGKSNTSNRAAIKILICSGAKQTCKNLYLKVDQCWNTCLDVFWVEWKECHELRNVSKERFFKQMQHSSRFVLNWIDGKPRFSRQSLHDLLSADFSLNFNSSVDETKIRNISEYMFPIPTIWTSLNFFDSGSFAAYSRGSTSGDVALIDLKNHLFLGELQNDFSASSVFRKNIQPIFHSNGAFVLFTKGIQKEDVIHFYSLEEQSITLLSRTPLPFSEICSMHCIHGHVIFHLKNRFAAIALDDLKNSDNPSFLYSELMPGILSVEKSQEKLLICREEKNQKLNFQFLDIEHQALKFIDCEVLGNPFLRNDHFDFRHAYHVKADNRIFLYQESRDIYKIGSISRDAVISSHSSTIKGCHLLTEFKNTLLLCSKDETNCLKIQTLEVEEGNLEINSIGIKGIDAFSVYNLISAKCILDKLFLVGFIDLEPQYEVFNTEYHLIVIDMATQTFESSHLLGDLLINKISFISSSLGKIHLMISQNEASYILKVDYS